jgi:hypothetical protein
MDTAAFAGADNIGSVTALPTRIPSSKSRREGAASVISTGCFSNIAASLHSARHIWPRSALIISFLESVAVARCGGIEPGATAVGIEPSVGFGRVPFSLCVTAKSQIVTSGLCYQQEADWQRSQFLLIKPWKPRYTQAGASSLR